MNQHTLADCVHTCFRCHNDTQKSKPGRRRKEAADAIKLPKLSDDEKGELVSHAVEVLQAAIHKVRLAGWGVDCGSLPAAGCRLAGVLRVSAGALARRMGLC
jgi:hypothetical protein